MTWKKFFAYTILLSPIIAFFALIFYHATWEIIPFFAIAGIVGLVFGWALGVLDE